MSYSHILYEKDDTDRFATLTFNRPDKLNALGAEMMDEMAAACRAAVADEDVNALIITGSGRAFSTGFDLAAENFEMDTEAWRQDMLANQRRMYELWNLAIPTVAAVNGYALAGGMELMLCCDLALAAEDARIGEPEIRHASGPPTLMMPWVAPIRHTKYLMYTGDMVSGAEAAAMHLVNKAVPTERLMPEARRLAAKLARIPVPGIRYNKLAINNAQLAAGLYNSWLYNVEVMAELHAGETGAKWFRLLFEEGLKPFLRAREAPFKDLDGE